MATKPTAKPVAKTATTAPAANPNTGYVEGGSAPVTPTATNVSTAQSAEAAAKAQEATDLAKEKADATAAATASSAGGNATGGTQLTQLQQQVQTLMNQSAQNSSAAQLQQAQQNITNQNALQLLQSTLAGYGIDPTGAISNAILGLTQKNYDAATITALAQNPSSAKSTDPNVVALANAWNTRFSGNVAREQAGLTPLDPATYISTEQSYQAVMSRAGIPASSPLMQSSYLGQLMGTDLSPAEVSERVDAATQAVTATDPFVTQQLQQQFGLTQADMVSHLLDPATAASVIQQKVQASTISGEAARQNLALNQQNAATLAAQGVTQAQANQAFTNVAMQIGQTQTLANMYGMNAAQVGNELTAAQTGANLNGMSAAQAQLNLQRIQQQEINQFSGSSGASKGSLYSEQEGVS